MGKVKKQKDSKVHTETAKFASDVLYSIKTLLESMPKIEGWTVSQGDVLPMLLGRQGA